MNATRKTLTILAAAAALAGGVSIAQTSAPSADATTNAGAAPSTPSTSADTNSTLSNSGSSTSSDSSTLSNSDSGKAPQADRN
jgi:hypothetical protein